MTDPDCTTVMERFGDLKQHIAKVNDHDHLEKEAEAKIKADAKR